MIKGLVCFFILSLLSSACVNKQQPVILGPSQYAVVGNVEAAVTLMNNDPLRCEGECPEFVGAFYMNFNPQLVDHQIKTSVSLCSVTLVDELHVITNKHCLAEALAEGDLCNDQNVIEIKFPKTGDHPLESYRCKKIVRTSKEYSWFDTISNQRIRRLYAPDWALIELTEKVVGRKPAEKGASREMMDGGLVQLFPVYFTFPKDLPSGETADPVGVIRQVKCKKVYSNDANIFTAQGDGPLMSLADCDAEIVRGNSGSGIFSEKEIKLLGVLETTSGRGGTGTEANCLPDWTAQGTDKCYFSDDQIFYDISKNIKYLAIELKKTVEELRGDVFWSNQNGFRWMKEEYKENSLADLEIEYSASWLKYFDYLQEKKAHENARQLEEALLRIVFIKVPECIRETALLESLRFPLGTLQDWNFPDKLIWEEEPVFNEHGVHVSNTINWSFPTSEVMVRVEAVSVKVEKLSDERVSLVFKSEVLPAPIKKLKFTLPLCKE